MTTKFRTFIIGYYIAAAGEGWGIVTCIRVQMISFPKAGAIPLIPTHGISSSSLYPSIKDATPGHTSGPVASIKWISIYPLKSVLLYYVSPVGISFTAVNYRSKMAFLPYKNIKFMYNLP